ncbi:DUF1810 domain-containing protein [Flavobacterium zepuense]|uniref:DUF1810 domain-containing protein n=1 Tax=Flavobacterium zepuense TaxID=2593302 RepID=A0A552V9D8_9FLAO|nr:DUF1810 domain-containing protein [Flavobacterium zepuense]TRW27087.1 DUF1810 domain-containing protein [Flavobacterium zepuense]
MKLEKAGRFLNAQNQVYLKALAEVKAGKKVTHWMWFIFPQLKGLGQSDTSIYYAIEGLVEAADYLKHPVLGKNLVEISYAVLAVEGRTANEIFGSPDDLKLCSSMTLFAQVKDTDPVFNEVLVKYFAGLFDPLTLKLL